METITHDELKEFVDMGYARWVVQATIRGQEDVWAFLGAFRIKRHAQIFKSGYVATSAKTLRFRVAKVVKGNSDEKGAHYP